MKIVCLAAGYGSRLKEITKDCPKPMIEIQGKPIIEHIIDKLYSHGLTEIIVKVHYLPGKIMDCIGDRAIYHYEPILFEASETLPHLKKWLGGDEFMVINCDTLSNVNYTDMMKLHKKGTITALMDSWRCAGVWIYDRDYFENKDLPIIPYRPSGLIWHDIGSPGRLEDARKHYESQIETRMSK